MDISKYTDYFHDGTLIDIQQKENEIIFLMWSAEIDQKEIGYDIPLSDDRLKGKLHVKNITKMLLNNEKTKTLKEFTKSAEILGLKITRNKILLDILYEREPKDPKLSPRIFSEIIIEAEEIYWEPVPDLFDPF